MKWEYYTENYKHYLQCCSVLTPFEFRFLIKDMFGIFGKGGIDYSQYGLEYGFDMGGYIKYMKFEDFYDDEIKWFFRKSNKQIWVKEKSNIVVAKLILGQE